MCVSFDPLIVYNNAFFACRDGSSKRVLKKDKIVLFCNILQNEVTKYSEKNNKYKHVYFDFAKETLLSFFDENFGVFSVIGDEIFLNKELKDQEIIEINDAYDECIKNALNNTRDIFCNYEEATI